MAAGDVTLEINIRTAEVRIEATRLVMMALPMAQLVQVVDISFTTAALAFLGRVFDDWLEIGGSFLADAVRLAFGPDDVTLAPDAKEVLLPERVSAANIHRGRDPATGESKIVCVCALWPARGHRLPGRPAIINTPEPACPKESRVRQRSVCLVSAGECDYSVDVRGQTAAAGGSPDGHHHGDSGRWVAVRDGAVVASAESPRDLVDELYEMGVDTRGTKAFFDVGTAPQAT